MSKGKKKGGMPAFLKKAIMAKAAGGAPAGAAPPFAKGGVAGRPSMNTGLTRAAEVSGRTFKKGGSIDGCAIKGKTKAR